MELKEKLRGAIVGFAFGDALGLGTEFMTRSEAATYYPGGLRHFDQIIRDAHRKQHVRGCWTHDTDLMEMQMECVLREGGLNVRAQAAELKKWLLDNTVDISPILPLVVNTPGWEESPIATAHRVWEENHVKEASNEAIQRSMVTALACPERTMYENTRKMVLMTNDDTRCVSTALIMAAMLHSLLYHEKERPYADLLEITRSVDPRTLLYLEKAHDGDILSLGIDDENTMTWARKTMAAALWGLWHGGGPSEGIFKVIALGGDADTNASLAGALLGVKHGYEALPEEKEKMTGLEKMVDLADRMAEHIDRKWMN